MRINIVILLITLTCLHVSAKVNAQKITITAKDAAIEQVFEQIEQKSGYDFFYDARQIKAAKLVTLNLKDAELETILDACFKDQPFSYSIQNRTIVVTTISATAERKPFNQPNPEPIITIKGKITDINNTPLIGVSVRLKGSNIGTITDQNGNYQIEGKSDGVLIFSFVGFQTMQIKVNNQAEINLTLIEYTSELKETVVKGYYTTTKELNTGNVRTVNADDISKQPVSDPLATLQGRVPGLFVQQVSGAPGREFKIAIRGQNSIANGNDPLIIVDGVQFNTTPLNSSFFGAGASTSPLNSISPSDIENITVLKDADATAIYGSRGANGVILISTKRGKPGATNFSINTYHGTGKVARYLNLMDTQEYLSMRRRAFTNDNRQPGAADYDLNGAFDLEKYTDWQKVMIGGNAVVHELQGGVSGGSDRTQFRIGAGYRKDGNVFPGNNNMKKINALVSLNHQSIDNKLNIDFSGNYVNGLNKMPSFDMTRYIVLAPNAPDLYDSDGNLNWQNGAWTNPFTEIHKRYTESSNNLGARLNASYVFFPGLKLESTFGYNKNTLDQKMIIPFSSLNPTTPDPKSARRIALVNSFVATWVVEPQLSYTRELWKGKLDVLIGSTFQETTNESISLSVNGFADDEQIESIVAGTTKTIAAYTPSQYKYSALYGRVGYTANGKYIVNLTARRDGSSRFGPGRQFGNFGAIGAAWIFNKERWLRNNEIISFGKLRASYGLTGNDRLQDYKYLSTYSYVNISYQGYAGLNPTQLTNENYGWETVRKLEIALEVSFFKDKLSLNSSYYRNRTGNQLVGYALPTTSGFNTVTANLPAVIQNTGIEIELIADVLNVRNFKWSTGFNISAPRNKLVSYPGIENSGYATQFAVGKPLSVLYRYEYTGIDPTTKLHTFVDKNKDGQITSAFDRSFVNAGVRYFGGWNNSFYFKSLRLDIFFSYVNQIGRNYTFNGIPGIYSSGTGNQPKEILNPTNLLPYTTSNSQIVSNVNLYNNSSGRISDASFIRLKNIKLSLDIPSTKTWREVLKSGSIFILGQNLFTITKYKGLDPESQSDLRMPPLRVLAAGINVNL